MSVLSFSNICGFSKVEAGWDGKAADVRYGLRGVYLQRHAIVNRKSHARAELTHGRVA